MTLKTTFTRQAQNQTAPEDVQEQFLLACQEGDTAAMKTVLQLYPAVVDAADDSGWTALHHAAMWAQTEAAQMLLDYGARTDLRDNSNYTAEEQANRMFYAPIATLIQDTENQRHAQAARDAYENSITQYVSGLKADINVRTKPLRIKK